MKKCKIKLKNSKICNKSATNCKKSNDAKRVKKYEKNYKCKKVLMSPQEH